MPAAIVDGKPVPSTAELLRKRLAPHIPAITAEEVYRAHRGAWAWSESQRGAEVCEIPARERFRHMLSLLGFDPPGDAFVDDLVEAHMAAVTGSYVFPESHRALIARLGRARRLAIFSNFDYAPGVHRLLTRDGLRERFDPVVISAEIGFRKPGRAAFQRALAEIGEPAAHVLFVGDSLADDVGGAATAGLDVAWLNAGEESAPETGPRPTFTLRALDAIEALLD